MSERLQAVKGTQSLIGDSVSRFHRVISNFEKVREAYGFQHIEVPVLEKTQVFARTIGEATDIVSKEMYSLQDRNGEWLSLRPEFTAGIARAYISEGWQRFGQLKVSTYGPVFRYERPQKGRFRQFHQVNVEVIGNHSPEVDVELLCFAQRFLQRLGVSRLVRLKINTLGDAPSRKRWRDHLVTYFKKYSGDLSEDSRERLGRNPLRILDSKHPADREVVQSAPQIDAYLTDAAADFYSAVLGGLRRAGVEFDEDRKLVRGLDYYSHTAFEFVTGALGAQGTVIGGGRYDGLIETLGGKPTPSVGWAGGIERLAELAPWSSSLKPQISIVPDAQVDAEIYTAVASAIRNKDYRVEVLDRGSFGKRMARADMNGSELTLIITPIFSPGWRRFGLDLKSRCGSDTEVKWQARIGSAVRPLFEVVQAPANERFDLVIFDRDQ